MEAEWDSRKHERGLKLAVLAALIAGGVGVRAARAGSAEAWGYNYYGQLGNGTTTTSSTPVPVSGMSSGVTAVAAGVTHSLAMQNGSLYAWGTNGDGELGNGRMTNFISTPVPVTGMSGGITAFTAGWNDSLAVRNGALYAWGLCTDGQLGAGASVGNSSTPVPVVGMSSGVTAIATNNLHSLAVQNGAAYAWGYDNYGQLGNNTINANSLVPVPVTGLSSGVTAIAAGGYHSLAVQNGGVWAWGSNQDGELGNGTTTDSWTPVRVSGLSSGVTAVAAANNFSLALQNGGVWGWGFNYDGELGDGTQTPKLMPERIDPADLTNIVSIVAAHDSSYALAADGTIWDWGYNYDNMLGQDSATSYYLTPQHLLPPNGYVFTSITAGSLFAVATLAAVPEPASLGLLALGGLALLTRRRRPSPRDAFAISWPEV